jgi:hypothetical protein
VKKVKNVLKLMFFGRSEGKGREREERGNWFSNGAIIPLSSFYPPKIDVVLKITIEFMIDHY